MNKTEWSGWVQAMGTFIALLALVVPIILERSRRARSEKERIKAIEARCASILHEIKAFCDATMTIMLSVSIGHMDSLVAKNVRDNFETIACRLDGVPYWELANEVLISDMKDLLKKANSFRISMIQRSSDAAMRLNALHSACIKTVACLSGKPPTLFS